MTQLTSSIDGVVGGTNGFDVFTPDPNIQTNQNVFGLGGTDILRTAGAEGSSVEDNFFNLIGGSGSTIYEIGSNSGGNIIEHPGISVSADAGDFDILSIPNLSIASSNTFIVEVNNSHLAIVDSNHTAILYFWQEPGNRLEEFRFADETLSFQQFSQNLDDYDGYLGNLTSASAGLPGLDNLTNSLAFDDFSELVELFPLIEESINDFTALSDSSESILSLAETDTSDNVVEFYRFQNQQFDSGTFLFATDQERDSILTNDDLSNTFSLEGDGNFAFRASTVSGDNLDPFYRLRSSDISGTYIYVGQDEYDAIFAENSSQRDSWIREGLDAQGLDIPDFYLFGAGTGLGTEFFRLQNNQNGTFLFASAEEAQAIESDPLLSSSFTNQGVAFESLL